MANRNIPGKIILRNDTASNWSTKNPILLKGEMGIETDTKKIKVGTGAATWSALPYFNDESGSVVKSFKASLLPANWSATAPYTQTITVAGLQDVMTFCLIDSAAEGTSASQALYEKAYGCITRFDSGTNTLTATCRTVKPVNTVQIQGVYIV